MPKAITETDEIRIDHKGNAAVIVLNRPKALNSLNLAMVRALASVLAQIAEDPAVACVVIRGEGERAFCAGGDIREIFTAGRAGDPDASLLFREEFRLNAAIARYPKPYVALMDGICMGGGIGISAHGSHRVVSERSRLAMPETGIGYVPDVGSSFLLPRTPGEIGTFIGLTGQDFGAADGIFAGLADVLVPSDRLDALVDALGDLEVGASNEAVAAVIGGFAEEAGAGRLSAQRDLIDRCFRFDTVEEILAALAREGGDFAGEARDILARRSPTSLKLTLRLLRAGRSSASLGECLEREFTVACGLLEGDDFYEGVRAAVIDKDRNPQWHPARLADVDEAALERYFVPRRPVLGLAGVVED